MRFSTVRKAQRSVRPKRVRSPPNWLLRIFVHHILEPVEVHPKSLFLAASVTSVVTTLGSPTQLPPTCGCVSDICTFGAIKDCGGVHLKWQGVQLRMSSH